MKGLTVLLCLIVVFLAGCPESEPRPETEEQRGIRIYLERPDYIKQAELAVKETWVAIGKTVDTLDYETEITTGRKVSSRVLRMRAIGTLQALEESLAINEEALRAAWARYKEEQP